jgi:hypothetical protein
VSAAVKNQLKEIEKAILALPPSDALECVGIVKQVVAGFGLKHAVEKITLVDILRLGLKQIGAAKK